MSARLGEEEGTHLAGHGDAAQPLGCTGVETRTLFCPALNLVTSAPTPSPLL